MQEWFLWDQAVRMTIEYFQEPLTYYTRHIDILYEGYLVNFLLSTRLTITRWGSWDEASKCKIFVQITQIRSKVFFDEFAILLVIVVFY